MGMTVEAQEARRNYKRQYRLKNREKINAQQREWRANHPAKVQEYQKRYWEKWAKKGISEQHGKITTSAKRDWKN